MQQNQSMYQLIARSVRCTPCYIQYIQTNIILQQCRLYSRKAKERVRDQLRTKHEHRQLNGLSMNDSLPQSIDISKLQLKYNRNSNNNNNSNSNNKNNNNKRNKNHKLNNKLKVLNTESELVNLMKVDNQQTEQFVYNKPSKYAAPPEHHAYQQRINSTMNESNYDNSRANESATGYSASGNEMMNITYDVKPDTPYDAQKYKSSSVIDIAQRNSIHNTQNNSNVQQTGVTGIITFIVDADSSVVVLKRMCNKLIQMYCNIEHTLCNTFGNQTIVVMKIKSIQSIGLQQIKVVLDRCLQSGTNSMINNNSNELQSTTDTTNHVYIKSSSENNSTLPLHSAALQFSVYGVQHPKLLVEVGELLRYANIHVITCDITTVTKQYDIKYTILNSIVMMPSTATIHPTQLQRRIAHIEKTYTARIRVDILDEPELHQQSTTPASRNKLSKSNV